MEPVSGHKIRVSKDLADFLKETFPPRCISEGETMEAAQRYAGKVELAQFLIGHAAEEDDVEAIVRSHHNHYR